MQQCWSHGHRRRLHFILNVLKDQNPFKIDELLDTLASDIVVGTAIQLGK